MIRYVAIDTCCQCLMLNCDGYIFHKIKSYETGKLAQLSEIKLHYLRKIFLF